MLAGFLHLLKSDGFVEIRVPDLKSVMKRMVAENMSLEDTLYESKLGPITVRDVIYGYGKEIESSGSDFYCAQDGVRGGVARIGVARDRICPRFSSASAQTCTSCTPSRSRPNPRRSGARCSASSACART